MCPTYPGLDISVRRPGSGFSPRGPGPFALAFGPWWRLQVNVWDVLLYVCICIHIDMCIYICIYAHRYSTEFSDAILKEGLPISGWRRTNRSSVGNFNAPIVITSTSTRVVVEARKVLDPKMQSKAIQAFHHDLSRPIRRQGR